MEAARAASTFACVAGRWTPRARAGVVAAAAARLPRTPGVPRPPHLPARAAATHAAGAPALPGISTASPAPAADPLSPAEFDSLVRAAGAPRRGETAVVAVSGGPDSLALLSLLTAWAKSHGVTVVAVTVDHGLRAESAAEAAGVHAYARGTLAVPHVTYRLSWGGNADAEEAGGGEGSSSSGASRLPRKSQVQTVARARRYAALSDVCRAAGASLLFTGHHQNDQIETMLYRFSRSSGVVGLAGMRPRTLLPCGTVTVVRPLLGVTKDCLQATCAALGAAPVQDPSNSNPAFDRVRVRRALAGVGAGEQEAASGEEASSSSSSQQPLPLPLLIQANAALSHTASDIQAEVSALISASCRIHPAEGYVMLWPQRLLGLGGEGSTQPQPRAELLAKLALARLLTVCSGRDVPVSASSIDEALAFLQRVVRTAALPRHERATLMPKGSWPSLATGQCLLKVMLTAEGKPLCTPQVPPSPGASSSPSAGETEGGGSASSSRQPRLASRPSPPPPSSSDPWQALLASEGISGSVPPPVTVAGLQGPLAPGLLTDDGVAPDALQVLLLRETASMLRRKSPASAGGGTSARDWRAADSLLVARGKEGASGKGTASSSSSSSQPTRGVALPSGLPVLWDNLFLLTVSWRPAALQKKGGAGTPRAGKGGSNNSGSGAAAPPGALEDLTPAPSSALDLPSPRLGVAVVRLSVDEWEYLSFLYPELQSVLRAFKEAAPAEVLAGLPVAVAVDSAGVPLPVARLRAPEAASPSLVGALCPPLLPLSDVAAAAAAASAALPPPLPPPPPSKPQPSRAPLPAAPSPPRQLVAGLRSLDEKARALMRKAAEEAIAAGAGGVGVGTGAATAAADASEGAYALAPPLPRPAVEALLDEALELLAACEAAKTAPGGAPPPPSSLQRSDKCAAAAEAAAAPAAAAQTELPHVTRLRQYAETVAALASQGVSGKSGKSSKAAAHSSEAGEAPVSLTRPWWHPSRRACPTWAEGVAPSKEATAAASAGSPEPPLQMASLQSYLRAVTARHAAAAAAGASAAGSVAAASRPVVLKAASLWENVDKQVVEAVVAVPHLRFALWPELTVECTPAMRVGAPGDSSMGITTP